MAQKVLLHACCAVCAGYPSQLLKELGYELEILFYNPNIYPLEEYERRKNELIRFCEKEDIILTIIEDDSSVYYNCIKGLESEPEKGSRCEKCFELRLEKTALLAIKHDADFFSTTLSVSPHKNFQQIKKVATALSQKYNISYLEMDFKKQDGFKKTNAIAKEYDFYRQDYCGCEFSIRKNTPQLNCNLACKQKSNLV